MEINPDLFNFRTIIAAVVCRRILCQAVICQGSVADVVFQHAAILKGEAAEYAFAQFLRGGENDTGILDHAVCPKIVDVFHPIALEGETEAA